MTPVGTMKSVMCVVGTRPEVIKMFPVVRALRAAGVAVTLVDTGQHKSLCRDAFDAFDLSPDVELDVMTSGQTPSNVAAAVIARLSPIVAQRQPSWLVVQGDTTTVLAAAIAGAYERVPVAHVEAGLRSNDLDQPFPEELNRRAVGAIARLHFAPTMTAVSALQREGIDRNQIVLSGNTVIDSLEWACDHLPAQPVDPQLRALDPTRPLVLLTAHRRENHGARLDDILNAVRRLTVCRPELQVLFPVHPNPQVGDKARAALAGCESITMTEPLGYLDLAWALRRTDVVLTDSGGLQEEAPALGKRVLVLRDVTERPEAIASGMACLVGTQPGAIIAAVIEALDQPPGSRASPYGDGHAGTRIADALQGKQVRAFSSILEAA